MSNRLTILLGRIDGDLRPGVLDQVVQDIRTATRTSAMTLIVPVNGEICAFHGPGLVVHLRFEEMRDEPWVSHPFQVDMERRDGEVDLPAVAERAYDTLLATGRYRLFLHESDTALRSTHFPLEDW